MKIRRGYFLKEFTNIFLNFYMWDAKKLWYPYFLTMKAHDLWHTRYLAVHKNHSVIIITVFFTSQHTIGLTLRPCVRRFFSKIFVFASFGNCRFSKIRVGASFSSFFRTSLDSRKLVPTQNSTRNFW